MLNYSSIAKSVEHSHFNKSEQHKCQSSICDDELCYLNGLVQDCSNSIANALELLKSCTKP